MSERSAARVRRCRWYGWMTESRLMSIQSGLVVATAIAEIVIITLTNTWREMHSYQIEAGPSDSYRSVAKKRPQQFHLEATNYNSSTLLLIAVRPQYHSLTSRQYQPRFRYFTHTGKHVHGAMHEACAEGACAWGHACSRNGCRAEEARATSAPPCISKKTPPPPREGAGCFPAPSRPAPQQPSHRLTTASLPKPPVACSAVLSAPS